MANQKLKILMLGWEFPPYITGGLGTACEGLTASLAKHPLDIHFFMPHLYGNESAEHLHLYDVSRRSKKISWSESVRLKTQTKEEVISKKSQRFYRISSFLSPYLTPLRVKVEDGERDFTESQFTEIHHEEVFSHAHSHIDRLNTQDSQGHRYGGSIFEEVYAYSRKVADLAEALDFDLIHAHDWMTFPAALALQALKKKPAILHVHSLESDRSGNFKNERIAEIERRSLQQADAVITVSRYTRKKVIEELGVSEDKIVVVHNGIKQRERSSKVQKKRGKKRNFRVLFLGRVTFQKGPEYFVDAAVNVLKILPNTEFILAGSGDMTDAVRKRIHQKGVEKHFILPGFLSGKDVDEMFASADLYVMPSVSEPFGISALEALYYHIPIIISRQSGVSEVITHALKVDFWDIEELSDLIIGALKHPELRHDLLQMAKQELKRLSWDASAEVVMQLYRSLSMRSQFLQKGEI